jgi:hypothetical protein
MDAPLVNQISDEGNPFFSKAIPLHLEPSELILT